MANKRILWIFPTLTQLIFSLFSLFFGKMSLEGLGLVFLMTALPAFLFALVCVRYQFHQRNLIQIAFWSGTITFLNILILLSILLAIEPLTEPISPWEHTLAVFFYALMFALPAMVYAMVVLRRFLEKKTII